jgi:acrylyl-CoA reductase (NADPH)
MIGPMADTFRALVLDKVDDSTKVAVRDLQLSDLPDGDVEVAVEYSTVNYKDGLCVTGASPIARTTPMVPGIDLAGVVTESRDAAFSAGDRVLMNGYGLSETHWGGYAQRARVSSDVLIPVPEGYTTRDTMAIGTAGYTAMLCVLALEDGGVKPGDGPVLVTGAVGGVGSVAVAILAKLGFEVDASTGRPEEADYLKGLGASNIVKRAELSEKGRALGKERWAGVVDSVGSHTLVNAIAGTKYGGIVSACGLAQGPDLPGTVMPFILRSVSLVGIDSVMAPRAPRERAWQRLVGDLPTETLARITGDTVGLADLPEVGKQILAGKVRGRLLVDPSL